MKNILIAKYLNISVGLLASGTFFRDRTVWVNACLIIRSSCHVESCYHNQEAERNPRIL